MGISSTRRRVCSLALAAAMVVAATSCQPSPAWLKLKVTGYTPVSYRTVFSPTSDQGPATVHPLGGGSQEIYAGEEIPSSFTKAGWNHVGDPDSLHGFVVYPYQAADPANGKMFNVVTPHGRSFDYTHALSPGEEYNNSFATISPDGLWLVSGEWDTESRLLVFPMPMLNHSVPAANSPLALAGTIDLDQPVTDVQGCDFVDATHLICSADDTKKELLDVALSAPLSGGDVTGTVTSLGPLPLLSSCTGTFEAEGLDFDPTTDLLRVEVIPPSPCFVNTYEYTYRRNH